MYYWAYGSNLNHKLFKTRCPSAHPVAPLYVPDGALIFRLVADAEYRKGSTIAGGLWRIDRRDELKLDSCEGVTRGSYDKRHIKILIDGKVRKALFYKMNSEGIMPPRELYLNTIIDGYHDFGLDTDLLKAALEESWQHKDKTHDLKQRYRRAGKPKLARPFLFNETRA